MKVLITGGAGYIGSTIASVLLDNGHTPIILDGLCRADGNALAASNASLRVIEYFGLH